MVSWTLEEWMFSIVILLLQLYYTAFRLNNAEITEICVNLLTIHEGLNILPFMRLLPF